MATEEEENEGPIKIEDSNMDGYGGEEHRAKQRAIAEKMPEWKGAGEKAGVRVWRIEKFRVKDWPEEEYGTFYGGDSFIVLHSYHEEGGEELLHNVHFWLGEKTSQDEAGTAAIKTVELDDKLGDLPVQYRQVQGHETKHFHDLFPNMNILEGGVDSGFRKVKPTEWETRLYHVYKKGKKKKGVKCQQIELKVENLNNNDCFLLDMGTSLYNFFPPKASIWEKNGARDKMNEIAASRHGKVKDTAVIDWHEGDPDTAEERLFWNAFGGKPETLPNTSEYEVKKKAEKDFLKNHVNRMYHITNEGDESGKVTTSIVAEGVLDRSILANEDDDVVLVDVGHIIYVWIGKTSNREEKAIAMKNAQDFVFGNEARPNHTPIKRIFSGREPADFLKCFGTEHVAEDICN